MWSDTFLKKYFSFFFAFLGGFSILTFSVSLVRPEGACSDTLGADLREEGGSNTLGRVSEQEGCGLTLF